ncbi:MAG: hypothetical protein ACE5DM_04965 [Candidatus Nanoarchaeia archaeon]
MKWLKRGILAAVFFCMASFVFAAPTIISLTEPNSQRVQIGDEIIFNIDGIEYQLDVTEMYTYSVGFTISGKLNEFLLHEDDYVEVNLDDFGQNDLKITAQAIIPRQKATILIERMHKPVAVREAPPWRPPNVPEPKLEPEPKKTVEEVIPIEEPAPVEEKPGQNYTTLLYGILTALAALIIISLLAYYQLARYAVAGVPPKLTKFVSNAIRQNVPEDEIYSEMSRAGWTDEEISLAMRFVKGDASAT